MVTHIMRYMSVILIKQLQHGSFGGPGLDVDDMYAAGSDDFHCYIWEIPPLPQLLERRKIFSSDEWLSETDSSTIGRFHINPQKNAFSLVGRPIFSTVASTEGRNQQKVVPSEISTPFCRLTGAHDKFQLTKE